jgi:CHAT domain-containing protein
MKIQWTDVQNHLKDNEAAVEFIMFSYYNRKWTDSTMYCALILKKGMEYPKMVPLFEQKQLDSLLLEGKVGTNDLYASRGITSTYEPQLPNGRKLYNLVWKPLEKELLNVKTVYYSPSGSLHQIAFAALTIDSTTYLCDTFNLVQLSSTRQLATLAWQTKQEQISSTALFGGIKYDLDGPEITKLQQSLPKNDLALSRGFTSDSTLRSNPYDSLPGTRKEVVSITAMLQANNIKTDLYTGINGNEEAFKALSNQNINVIHIATHGFFYPDEKVNPQDMDRMMLMGDQKFRNIADPLSRSGLILAGGNRTWKGEEPIARMEDGILTAKEISEMNLQNTELVVLSACETGLGDIKGGEGVFGLQRAFKLAGVKTIIMSLWKVPDGSTSEMMQLFYSKWLRGMDKRDAFRETQREMHKRYPKSPKDWAGFVMLD